MNFKYFIGTLITIPILPLLYFQGKKTKASIPDLPEAKGMIGECGSKSNPLVRLLVIGESTMAGVGVETHQEGFTGTLAEELASKLNIWVQWSVKAKSGITAGRVPQEILSQLERTSWDLIVIGLGGNDAFALNGPGKWKKDVAKIIFELRRLFVDPPIVFTNMPPIKEFPAFTPLMKFTFGNLVELLGEALDEVASNLENVYYSSEVIRIEKWAKRYQLSSETSQFFSDGVHPSKLTYQTLAKELANFIQSNVKIKS